MVRGLRVYFFTLPFSLRILRVPRSIFSSRHISSRLDQHNGLRSEDAPHLLRAIPFLPSRQSLSVKPCPLSGLAFQSRVEDIITSFPDSKVPVQEVGSSAKLLIRV